jgi:7-cyano-7-deazaguanine synthase
MADNTTAKNFPNQSKNGVIVLLSAGLDSTVALADILQRRPVLCVLTFDYGQKAARREIESSAAIAKHYGLTHRIVALPWLAELLPDALNQNMVANNPTEVSAAWQTLSEADLFDIQRVWVPNRNGVFLNIAASYAEAWGATGLIFGANAEEGVDFPDNTPEFRDRVNASLAYSTLTGVTVETPVGHLRKDAIVALGQTLQAPFDLIWSCYEGADEPCNACPSCIRTNAARTAKAST